MRIIVTGSRDLSERKIVSDELDCFVTELVADGRLNSERDITIVHGACPTGADKFADDWARECGAKVERHPADWGSGLSAGPKRNRRMADYGADLCIAFWDGRTHKSGTHSMIVEATLAGIPVRIVPKRRGK